MTSALPYKPAAAALRARVVGARNGIEQELGAGSPAGPNTAAEFAPVITELKIAERCQSERGLIRCLHRAVDMAPKWSRWHTTLEHIYRTATVRVIP
jgi:hypothetical protein